MTCVTPLRHSHEHAQHDSWWCVSRAPVTHLADVLICASAYIIPAVLYSLIASQLLCSFWHVGHKLRHNLIQLNLGFCTRVVFDDTSLFFSAYLNFSFLESALETQTSLILFHKKSVHLERPLELSVSSGLLPLAESLSPCSGADVRDTDWFCEVCLFEGRDLGRVSLWSSQFSSLLWSLCPFSDLWWGWSRAQLFPVLLLLRCSHCPYERGWVEESSVLTCSAGILCNL